MASALDFEAELGLELGSARPPPQYLYTAPSPTRKACRPKTGAAKVRTREARRRDSSQLADLSSSEAELLEAQLGMAPAELPRHLRAYALQRRSAACFSGPGLLPGEQEVGHIEYKLRLLDPTPSRFQQLVTQLNWRLSEGCGQCLYALGVEDNGHPKGLDDAELAASLAVLRQMVAEAGAEAEVLQTPPGSSAGLRCAVVRVVRSAALAPAYADLRVAVAGGVDSGKSTLVAVLTNGAGGAPALDNGRGSSRTAVFRHKHEILSGHTSSISLHTAAYGADGTVLNYSGISGLAPGELAAAATRMLCFFDLGGHERYSKTALHGLTCLLPDYVMLCVSTVAGVSWVTREHLAVAIALGVPLFVALTKADLASEAAVQQVAAEIRELLASAVRQAGGAVSSPAMLAPLVESQDQAVALAASMHHSSNAAPGASLCVPLFCTSSVTGSSLQLLHSFMNALQPAGSGSQEGQAAAGSMQGWQQRQAVCRAGDSARVVTDALQGSQTGANEAHFQIDRSFEVAGVGTVYSGTVVSGSITVGDELLLGPLEGGRFSRVAVTGIHRSKVDVRSAQQGQHATIAVQPLEEAAGPAAAEAAGGTGSCAAQRLAEASAACELPVPARADSASCLHAWMQQSGSAAAGQGDSLAGPGVGASQQQQQQQQQPPLPPSTPALAIQPRAATISHGLASSHSAAQLSLSSQQHLFLSGSGELRHCWGSSPQLTHASSGPAPRPRKGAVLLGPSLHPQACFQFEAVLVLLGGHWPARGLLSGCYPPEGEMDDPDPALAASCGPSSLGGGTASDCGLAGSSFSGRSQSLGRLRRTGSRRRGTSYIPVVHCGSIRQSAQVVSMRELPRPCHVGYYGGSLGSSSEEASSDADEEEEEDPFAAVLAGDLLPEPSGASSSAATPLGGDAYQSGAGTHPNFRLLAGAVAAAGVLLPQPCLTSSGSSCLPSAAASGSSGHASGCEGSSSAVAGIPTAAQGIPGQRQAMERQRSLLPSEDIGCLAAVTFSFMHQPEWLVEGARLIMRDRTSGRVAGAGYVASINLPAGPHAPTNQLTN